MSNTETKNEVFITGRVIAIHNNANGAVRLTVLTRNGKDVYAKCYCPNGVPSDINVRSRVCINGHIDAYMRRDSGGVYRSVQQVVVDRIYKDSTIVEQKFGVKGHFYNPFQCEISLKGKVVSFQDQGQWFNMTLEVDGDNNDRRKHNVRLGMRKIDRQPVINEGDTVYAVCSLSTPKKEVDDRTIEFTNIVVSDIAVEPQSVGFM